MKLSKGFTLIELVIVIVLVGIIGSSTALLLRQTFKSYFTGKKITDIALKTSIASNILIREIKNLEVLNSIAATSMTYTNHKGESITIDFNSSNLRRSVNSASAQILCNQVSSVAFNYYDSTYAVTATPANVRYITVTLTTQDEGIPYSLMSGTTLRRLLP